jgi:hypothetical protein
MQQPLSPLKENGVLQMIAIDKNAAKKVILKVVNLYKGTQIKPEQILLRKTFAK